MGDFTFLSWSKLIETMASVQFQFFFTGRDIEPVVGRLEDNKGVAFLLRLFFLASQTIKFGSKQSVPLHSEPSCQPRKTQSFVHLQYTHNVKARHNGI